ncbi:hypothetical protein KIL84_005634 [Mauremys mutica]|uniref:Uncharacterized protein n=1 Tax=Mauremys mutica TaxID=74926 RepID=A0A9D3XFF6_9SAUR|nr:hypothetical protein KIL84_005634 [Mauremys mutica]
MGSRGLTGTVRHGAASYKGESRPRDPPRRAQAAARRAEPSSAQANGPAASHTPGEQILDSFIPFTFQVPPDAVIHIGDGAL